MLFRSPLPDWMVLHFQIDPRSGWESPQVLAEPVAREITLNFADMPATNLTAERGRLLTELRGCYKVDDVVNVLATKEAALAPETPLAVNPDLFQQETVPAQQVEDARGQQNPKRDPATSSVQPLAQPQTAQPVPTPTSTTAASVGTIRILGFDLKVSRCESTVPPPSVYFVPNSVDSQSQ